jgi:hypothetical protein
MYIYVYANLFLSLFRKILFENGEKKKKRGRKRGIAG